jgi:hypothetical protein
MNGQIDELYIYDEAISAATVNSLFNAVTGPVTIPEPAGAVLLTLGFAGLGIRRRRDHWSDSLSTPSRLDPHESTDS